jgi:hypothetical protein
MKWTATVLVIIPGAFLFIGGVLAQLKSTFISTGRWNGPHEAETYEVGGQNGRTIQFILLPDNRAIVSDSGPQDTMREIALLKTSYGSATHGLGPVWILDSKGFPFGFRLYPPDVDVEEFEGVVMNKALRGIETSRMPPIGSGTNQVLLLRDDSVWFDGVWLQKAATDQEFVRDTLHQLDQTMAK